MKVQLNAYIGFKDDARQAMEFYHSIFGGELKIATFKEFHASEDPAEADKVMHGYLEGANGLVIMGADTPNGMTYDEGARISMSLSGDEEQVLRGYWDALSAGGSITMPIDKAPWGDTFGMLTDKFGIKWMVNISDKKA